MSGNLCWLHKIILFLINCTACLFSSVSICTRMSVKFTADSGKISPPSWAWWGFRIFPDLIRLKPENKKRALNTLKSRTMAFKSGKMSEEEYSQALMSITEHLKIADTLNMRKDIFNKMFF